MFVFCSKNQQTEKKNTQRGDELVQRKQGSGRTLEGTQHRPNCHTPQDRYADGSTVKSQLGVPSTTCGWERGEGSD